MSFELVVAFAAKYAIVMPIFLVLVEIIRRRRFLRDCIEATFGGILAVSLAKVAGTLYTHERPFIAHHTRALIAHIPDNSFPSDHLALCGVAVAFLWPRNQPLCAVVILVAGVLGAARMIAELHFLVDIIWGFVLGAGAGFIATALLALLWRDGDYPGAAV